MSNDRVELQDEELQTIAGGSSPEKVIGIVKLQIPGGEATSEPPVEPALSIYGVDISKFLDEFNERTKEWVGQNIPIPTTITIYADHSFSFVTKTPPASLKFRPEVNPGPGVRKEKIGPLDKLDFDSLK